jgi:hypothetical protein
VEISDFKELFNYNHKVRQNYIDAFKQNLSWQDVIKKRNRVVVIKRHPIAYTLGGRLMDKLFYSGSGRS